MNHSQSLAINEFSFRYLYPQRSKDNTPRPLNSCEKVSQFSSAQSIQQEDMSEIVLASLLGKPCPSDKPHLQLVYAISKTHLPNYITSDSPYGRHCDYPSPRSYYPLKFLLYREINKEHKLFHVNLEQWVLDEVVQPEHFIVNDMCDNDLIIQTDFTIYNELYNRFRYGLFALEVGHFQRALTRHLQGIAKSLILTYHDSRFIGRMTDAHQSEQLPESLSNRTAGFFKYGLLPKRIPEVTLDFVAIASHFHALMRDYLKTHPQTCTSDIDLKVIIDNTTTITPGLYHVEEQGLRLAKGGRFMPVVQEAYNYKNFSFLYSSCVFFFTVSDTSFHDNTATVCTNSALGYFSQCLIEWFTAANLFARPFRSYDQMTIDTLFEDTLPNGTAYYGLLVGNNRAAQSLGAIK